MGIYRGVQRRIVFMQFHPSPPSWLRTEHMPSIFLLQELPLTAIARLSYCPLRIPLAAATFHSWPHM